MTGMLPPAPAMPSAAAATTAAPSTAASSTSTRSGPVRRGRRSLWLATCLATLPVGAASWITAPVVGQEAAAPQAIAPADITALLAKLDAAFVAGDLDALRGHFEPDHPGAVAMFVHHLEALLRLGARRERRSEIHAGPQQIGALTLVRVRHETRWPDAAGKPDHPAAHLTQPLREDSYLTVRRSGDRLVATFAIDVPVQVECVADNRFRCPACNYQIGGLAGWQCVPITPERGGALEAASFYLLGTDLSLDVTVRIEPAPEAAAAAAERLAAELAELAPHATVGVTSRWLPPHHEQAPPAGLDGARVVIELSGTGSGERTPARDRDDDSRAVLHVVTFGRLQHVLLARGSRRAFATQAARLGELLQTYELLQVDRDLAEAAAMPLLEHTGGWLEHAHYRNTHYDVELRGPADWRPSQRTGGALFRVAWTGPDGGRLWLIGHRVPAGMDRWTEADVDRWLTSQCEGRGLEIVTAKDDRQWQPTTDNWCDAPGGGRELAVELRSVAATDPATPRHRTLRLLVYPDLLVVADAHAKSDREQSALQQALPTLRRGK